MIMVPLASQPASSGWCSMGNTTSSTHFCTVSTVAPHAHLCVVMQRVEAVQCAICQPRCCHWGSRFAVTHHRYGIAAIQLPIEDVFIVGDGLKLVNDLSLKQEG